MQIDDFKSIVSAFADPGSEILFDKSKVLISVNGDLVEASLSTKLGDVYVDEGSGPIPGSTWIVRRLAKLPLLATRLVESVSDNDVFVTPAATLLPSLTVQPDDTSISTNDALASALNAINERSPLETTVLYVTSDAGEGKTSLINQMARLQAKRFAQNEADWILVPIPLGGRHFLRFDDITVGALQNRYRFPFLYYNSFLALVKMGVLVPAFDGFEEMFVENSSGEALSAMGILVGALESKGGMLIAARKAYFEFENLKAQERLYDTIRNYSVGFAKLELHRWSQTQFLAYCERRKIPDAEIIYDRVSERLGKKHSLLTRPVLVRRLVDIASESPSLEDFLGRIHASGADYFSVFVRGIIEREAIEKWVDRSGEVGMPLLTVDEHCELLSLVALGMWEARVDYLNRDHLEFTTDFFSETKRKSAFQAQQIKERIRGHALLIPSVNAVQAVEFDHEEFRLFFLGEALADQLRPLTDRAKGEVLTTLRKGILPRHAQHAFIRAIKRDPKLARLSAAEFLLRIAALDGQASYTQENCSALIARLLSDVDGQQLKICGLAFGMDAIRDRKLSNLNFENCFFGATSLEMTHLVNCRFTKCKFSQLRVYDSTKVSGTAFDDCSVDTLRLAERDIEVWEPAAIRVHLERLGIAFQEMAFSVPPPLLDVKVDPELHDLEKLLRYFMRNTHVSEKLILLKLGGRARHFLDYVLPELLFDGVFVEIENRGGGDQRRFKISLPLHRVNQAISAASGSYARFRELIRVAEAGS